MIQESVIPIDFGQGLDTKADPKLVVAGKMLRLENGVFTNMKRIAKRNGYAALSSNIAGGGTLTAPQMVDGFQDQLICQDAGRLYSYSSTQNVWFARGSYISTELQRSIIDQSAPASGYTDNAVLGNYAIYAWSTASKDSTVLPKAYASVVDLQTGAILNSQLLTTGSVYSLNPVRCVVLGSSKLAVLYLKADASAIVIRVVTIAAGSASFSAETTVGTNYAATTAFLLPAFDVISISTGAAFFYINNAGVKIVTLDTSGAVALTSAIADGAANGPVSISQTSNGNLWCYWTDQTNGGVAYTSGTIYYAVFSSALALVLVKTSIVALASPYFVTNMVTVNTSATAQILYYGQYAVMSGTKFTDFTSTVTTTSAGSVGSPAVFAYGVSPYSRTFSVSSVNYAVFVYRGALCNPASLSGVMVPQIEPTYFIVQLATALPVPLVVGRFGSGLANNQAVLGQLLRYTPNVTSLSATKFLFSAAIETQAFLSDSFSASATFPIASPGTLSGNFAYTIDFSSANAYQATNTGELALLNGGVIQAYDGQSTAEFGFHLFPEIASLTQSGGGAIVNGVYSYIAIFQWTDSQGNLHQSAPSQPVAITTSGGNGTVTAVVTTAYLTQKSGISCALFRTQASGSVYFQVNDPVFVTSATPGTVSISFVDTLVDTSIAGNPQPYTYPASSVLENSTPPPSMILLAHNNRLFFVDSENPNTEWYTKTAQNGVGLSPSAFLIEQLDTKLGSIVALAEMDDKIVTLKQRGIVVQAGDGANDTGAGSTFSNPQFIPSDVGCNQMKSVITTPTGVMFHSVNGIYMLNRSLNVTYIGAEVEAYNSQTITAATLVPGKSQIRFLCSTGLTLVYDYIFNQWSTFTAHTGLSATTFQSLYTYATAAGLVFQESATLYADNGVAYSLLAQTSWLALASVQGFQRVRRLIMLGDFVNGNSASHNLSIAAAYDFSTTFQAAVTYAFGAISASGVFQYRERLPIQKCDSISLLIQETTTGSTAEYIDLTNISFEAGIKKGVNKLGGAFSVG